MCIFLFLFQQWTTILIIYLQFLAPNRIPKHYLLDSILQEWLDWKFILPSHPLCGILFVLKVLCILIVSLCIIKSQTIWKMHWLHNLFYLGRIHLPPGMWIRPLSQTSLFQNENEKFSCQNLKIHLFIF